MQHQKFPAAVTMAAGDFCAVCNIRFDALCNQLSCAKKSLRRTSYFCEVRLFAIKLIVPAAFGYSLSFSAERRTGEFRVVLFCLSAPSSFLFHAVRFLKYKNTDGTNCPVSTAVVIDQSSVSSEVTFISF